ncbi:MAG: TonB-dependent receptor [Woeseiaceae bacterium]
MLLNKTLSESFQNRINIVRLVMFKPTQITRPKASAIFTAILTLVASAAIFAQETVQSDDSTDAIEEVVVTGTRSTIQRSIDLKRNATQIVDGLSAEEIGDIPALSIGAALETITGATSHRENGGATELSVRGLGPFLGTTVVNGREATNGGGNRAVNFSIFPSEMFNQIAIHKTQSAEYIEGAVSGQVHLDTKKPLDYGKRLLQANVKLAHSPDESNIEGGQDYGSRATFAYIDQFDFDNGARLGVSLGVQARDETNPEQEYQATSGGGRLEACELTSFASNALPTETDRRCHDDTADVSNDEIQDLIDANPNYDSVDDIPFAYIPRDHRYRQNTTDDEREAIFASFQLQPNDRLDITLDFQYSERDQRELRKDLQWGSTQEDLSALTSNPSTGVVFSSVSETTIHSYTTDFQRLEEYEGYGINFDYALTDNLSLTLDYASSDTNRWETDVELRLGATDNNIVDSSSSNNADDFTVQLDVNQGSGGAPIATILDDGGNGFEVTDPSYFNARNRARIRARQIFRDNTLDALRADLEWTRDSGAIHTVKAGVRSSSMEYFTRGGLRNDEGRSLFEDEDMVTPDGVADDALTDALLANVLACADRNFPESDFLSNVRNDQLITNTSSGSAVSSFATFDFDCAANAWLAPYGGLSGIQFQNGITSGTNDVTEDTLAFYVQADFETEFGRFPVRGNFGVRVVDTDITSVGYRRPITVEEVTEGFVVSEDSTASVFETDTQKNDYQEVLPSLTVIVDLDDDLILRGGLFRGMSRPDPNAYGNGRAVQPNDANDPYATLDEAVSGITATGNPYLRPILSTNVDLGLEWYPNADTMIAGALYWKKFNGAFENVAQIETFNLDGNPAQGLVETTQISNDDSTLKGFEISLTHSFDYLPGFWSGFGGKLSYNYADSDFEFEDQHGGDGVELTFDENTGEFTESALIGILPPANLFGLSEHVTSAQLYWSNEKWNVEAFHKTRSGYFQQFTRDTQGRIRYTNTNQRLDLKVRYKMFDNVDVTLEAKNILDEPRIDYRAVDGNVYQALSYGPRYFIGARVKF